VRPRDLLPLVIVGGLAAFVGVQVIRRPPAPEARHIGSVVSQGASAPAQSVGGAPVPPAEPAPVRDEPAIQVMLHDGAPGTYIMNILGDQKRLLIRWPERQADNLRVWIERTPEVGNWDPQYPIVTENAFAEWRAAGFPLSFQFVHDSGSAQIQIRWSSAFAARDGRQIGVTNKTYDDNGWIVRADIVLATHDVRGSPLPSDVIGGVARHEIGHALGLGHSPSTSDVMYPESRTPVISAADRATLHLLYKLPPGVMP
jgi:hypothetical protein